jgi:hypothetical protein
VDLDQDGQRDILSGSYSRMEQDMAGLFQVLRGTPGGDFAAAEVLKGTDSEPLIIPLNGQPMTENICTRPFAVDWDADEKLDLLVGNFSGTFYWFRGEGKGRFHPKPEPIQAGNNPLRIDGAHSDPFVIDWDGDGDLDILSGSSKGGVQLAENTAGSGKPPAMAPFKGLIEPGPSRDSSEPLAEKDLKGPTTSTRVWAEDVDGDGKLDLLVGDSVTLVAPANGLSVSEFQQKLKAWQAEMETLAKDLNSDQADDAKRQKASEAYSKLYEQRSQFMNEDSTGFVWLYRRK